MRGMVLAIAAGIALGCGDAPAIGDAPAPAPPSDRPAAVTETSPAHPLAPHGTLVLSRADFPAEGPVRVALGLAEPSANDEPRPVRMFSQTDQRGIQTHGQLDATRMAVTIELDPAWLLPGTYFVEVATTERSPLAIRRYAIVVR